MRNIKFLVAVFSVSGILSFNAAAADDVQTSRILPKWQKAQGVSELKPSVGVSTGLATGQDGRRDGTNWGVQGSFQPLIPIGVGLEVGGYVSDKGGSSATMTRTRVMARATYNLGGNLPVLKDSFVGVGIGAIIDNEARTTDTNFGAAPLVGFDIPLRDILPQVSLGAEASYTFVGGAKSDVFALNGVAKYWF